jgi:zinc transporter ZupT
MLTACQWVCLVSILAATFAGGFYPLTRPDRCRERDGFPVGEAFTAGVFLALSLTLMLPSAMHLLGLAFPGADIPVASIITGASFVALLGLEHVSHGFARRLGEDDGGRSHPAIPLIMTAMIAVPSFFLGTALGVSATDAAVFIFIAIMLHKSSAAFAMALKMVRSTLTGAQTWLAFVLFAFATPTGIVVGEDIHLYMGHDVMVIVKGSVLSVAAGVFLYMATLHEHRKTPMISRCCHPKGFAVMLAGFVVTVFVRFLIGEAHKLG